MSDLIVLINKAEGVKPKMGEPIKKEIGAGCGCCAETQKEAIARINTTQTNQIEGIR